MCATAALECAASPDQNGLGEAAGGAVPHSILETQQVGQQGSVATLIDLGDHYLGYKHNGFTGHVCSTLAVI